MSNLNASSRNIVKWIMNRNTILEKSYWAKLTPQEQELYKDVREDFLKNKQSAPSGVFSSASSAPAAPEPRKSLLSSISSAKETPLPS